MVKQNYLTKAILMIDWSGENGKSGHFSKDKATFCVKKNIVKKIGPSKNAYCCNGQEP